MFKKISQYFKLKHKYYRLGLGALILGSFMASVIYADAQYSPAGIPGSKEDPLVTRSYVDQAFAPLEKRINQLKTRIAELPRYEPVAPPTNASPSQVQVMINGQTVNFPDQKPFINPDTDRTLVPIRMVMEAVGAEVQWFPVEKKAMLTKDNTQIFLWIGKKEAQVNGELKFTDQPALIVNDRTMVPLRFFSENLGYAVEWDAPSRTARIRT